MSNIKSFIFMLISCLPNGEYKLEVLSRLSLGAKATQGDKMREQVFQREKDAAWMEKE